MRVGSRRRQAGATVALIALAVLLIVGVILIGRMLTREQATLDETKRTESNLIRVTEAFVNYAAANRTLPCPALGTSDTGDAAVGATADTCAANAFVVPWKTLGLRRDDAIDGWGRKLSYRVFTGPTGFTTAEGVSVVNCNSRTGAVTGATMGAGSQCNADHRNNLAAFVAARTPMLSVNERGTMRNDIAFVLVSHGATGAGAFTADGAGQVAMPAVGGGEAANAGTAPPFRIDMRSDPSIAPTDAAHFDDLVAYKSFSELVAETKLVARDWGIDPASLTAASQGFSRAEVTAALGSPAGNNTGVGSITFGSGAGAVNVIAFGDTARNVSSGIGGSGEGIGSIGSGSSLAANTTMNSATNEGLILQFATRARRFGVTMVDFGTVSGDPETVQFHFYQTWTGLFIHVAEKRGCAADPVKANFQILDVPDDYDLVVVYPRVRQSGTADSQMLLGAFRTCTSDAVQCIAPNAVAAQDCP